MNGELEISAKVYAFLADRDSRELSFNRRDYTYTLIKSKYDAETDFVYILREYNAPTAHSMNGKAECAGIYSYITSTFYGNCYDLRFLEPCQTGICHVTSALNQMETMAIIRKVDESVEPVARESESAYRNKEYYLRYGLEEEAIKFFYSGETPCYNPKIDMNNLTITDIVGAINCPYATAERLADDFIAKNRESIAHRLWELSILPDKISEMEATPNGHHYRRAIARCIGNEKTVHLEIRKDGVTCSCKISTDALKRMSGFGYDYPDWHMDAQSRAAFHKAYGKRAELFPADIYKITYGKKTLYEKE